MFLRNVWNVVAWSHDLKSDAVLARRVLGEGIVLFRKASGQVVAFSDRCPHRQAPLSLGRREGDLLRCMYHGLAFDGSGRCVEIPGHQGQPPASLDVRTFPVVERDKYIWIWMGDPAKADPNLLPDTRRQDSPEWHFLPGYLHYDAGYLLIMDNLLDFSHLGFVHEKTLGGGRESSEVRAKVQRFDWGLRITRKYGNVPLPPFLAQVAPFGGLVDRWQIYDWHIAGNVLIMNSGAAPAGLGALEEHIVPGALRFHSIQSLTPEDEKSTHYFFMFAHNLTHDIEEMSAELFRQTRTAFDEDKAMIEAQQRNLPIGSDPKMGSIPADAALFQGRRLIDRMLQAEGAAR